MFNCVLNYVDSYWSQTKLNTKCTWIDTKNIMSITTVNISFLYRYYLISAINKMLDK